MKNGFLLYQDRLRAVIATGFARPTRNEKTGHMIQTWILRRDLDPVTANHTGKDKAICGTCPLRGINGQDRTCYVTLAQAPLAVWKAYRRGEYLPLTDWELFEGRAVRLGAYGDPCFIPFPLVRQICTRSNSWTGYTHQWRNPAFASYREYLMASVENETGAREAWRAGWRTFRVAVTAEKTAHEIVCVNETRGKQCVDCQLCSGAAIAAKSIVISVHGAGAGHFKN